jgi:TPP-dependent pyruvate/acetoin dehydrogenase alpha subunit
VLESLIPDRYRDNMKIVTETKHRDTLDNFKGFLQENPTWGEKKDKDEDVERRMKEYKEKNES